MDEVRSLGGARNGLSPTEPFDRWYRYPAGFSPSSLKLAMDAVIGSHDSGLIVDPFAGTGSVGTAAAYNGGTFVGLEAHPEIAELAALKFDRPNDAFELAEIAKSVAIEAQDGDAQVEHELMLRCFDEPTLSKLVGLRSAVKGRIDPRWQGYLKWALLGTLRDVAKVKVGWPYQRPALKRTAPHRDVARRFVQRATWMADDLANAPPARGSRVYAGDSRDPLIWQTAFASLAGDASISSPPYLNNFDYADATRIELYFWGVVRSWGEMCRNVRSDMIIATTQQTRIDIARDALAVMEKYPITNAKLLPITSALATERAMRKCGKEYDRVIGPYFGGLSSVLCNLFTALRPGAKCAWLVGDSAPYGIYIDTPGLIGSIAGEVGFTDICDTEVRVRGGRWRGSGVRHNVELTERLITFKRP